MSITFAVVSLLGSIHVSANICKDLFQGSQIPSFWKSIAVDPIFGIPKNVTYLVGKSVEIYYGETSLTGTVLEIPNRQLGQDSYILRLDNGKIEPGPFTGITKLRVKLYARTLSPRRFMELFGTHEQVAFTPPWGPANREKAREVIGKKVALYAKDPANFELGELITGQIINGYPSSPIYEIKLEDGSIRSLYYLYIHDLRILPR
ncbi:MAG: hypothetical protein ABL958_18605 [Bdellovibrionia bacterium]